MFKANEVKNQIVEWIKQYFEHNASKDTKAIVGISGGKDSSIVAALCVEALGKDRVFGVLLPQKLQSDFDYAEKLVKHLGISFTVINIGAIVDSVYLSMHMGGGLGESIGELSDVTTFNTPARIRMTMLYAVSGTIGGRVSNNCNLSEDWVGYSTKFGDSVGDFSPLSNLTVTEVKAIGKTLNLPIELVDKIPIDGLCGKSDEDNLGFSYEVLDKYIRTGICEDIDIKNKIDKLHLSNLHKLRPMPCFEIKMSDLTF